MRILLIEDDRAPLHGAAACPASCGLYCRYLPRRRRRQSPLCGGAYDVCVLDRMLPGWTVLACCGPPAPRDVPPPVLMLTALSGINDRVDGLMPVQTITWAKPFDTRELLARLRALTRRPGTTAESAIRCGDVTLDAAQLTLSGPKAAAALTKRGGRSFRGTAAHTGAAADPCGAFWRGFGDHWPKLRTLIWTVTSILCGGG